MNNFLTLIFLAFSSLATTLAVDCEMAEIMEQDFSSLHCHCGGIGQRNSGLLGSFCDDTCYRCDASGTTCVGATVWTYMRKDSSVRSMFNTYFYKGKRSDRIGISKFECSGGAPNSLDNLSCGRCTIKVNYVPCNSCSLQPGSDNTVYPWGGALSFDCSNIEPNAIYDMATNPAIPADSVFAALSRNDPDNYGECIRSEEVGAFFTTS